MPLTFIELRRHIQPYVIKTDELILSVDGIQPYVIKTDELILSVDGYRHA
jgi:hypothetical protein